MCFRADLISDPICVCVVFCWHLGILRSNLALLLLVEEEEEEEEEEEALRWLAAPFTKPVTVQLTSERDENIPINPVSVSQIHMSLSALSLPHY